ncbi:small integral membrane protein 8 isoform X1 [Phyllopteryx taeniolatus]|uniref:small integral membrane protein 8 isoform X1 n=1 Tax=Phyllopteryx taeniolatus TaxID=161469 RepID=UPI002AD37C78|nr:small integral membrane protein 8 isoform X1 [Phyllopteryx taeniolatus]
MASKDSNKGKKGVIETDYRTPGLKGAQTTTLFRAVNPELFIKPVRDASHPNKPMMAFGLITITLCVGYLGYLHAMKANDQQLYEAIDGEGERLMRRKASKWA